MGSTTAVVLAIMRTLLPEASAIEWTDPVLIACLDFEYQEWAAKLGQLPGPGWFTMASDTTLAANATTVDLSALLNSTTVGTFAAVKTCWYSPEAGERQRVESCSPGQEEQFTLPIGQSAVGQQKPRARWLTRPAGVPTLNFGPEANVARNIRLYLRYRPPTLGASSTLQTDPRHDYMLATKAVLKALLMVVETDPVLKAMADFDEMKFLEDERMAAGEHESETTKVVVSDEMFG